MTVSETAEQTAVASRSGRAPTPAALGISALAGIGATVVSWYVAQHSLIGARWAFLIPVTTWVPLWLGGAWAATRIEPRRLALGLVLFFAVTTRLAATTGTAPSISNDLYRYGWDAHVQLSGIDPYRYPPTAPQLVRLRTAPQFPGPASCARRGHGPGCTTMNRPNVRTVYPPVAEAWFDVVAIASPGNDARQWQIAGALVDVATVGLLMVGLARTGQDPRKTAWYALSPIPIIELAGNGHVDGLGVLLLVAAVLALQRGRRAWAGVLIGLATMVKLYPGLAVVAAWRRGRWPMLAAATATAVICYAPHVLAVGDRIVGYLPGYLSEEHYGPGGRFLLIGILPLPGRALSAMAVLAVAASVGWVLTRRLDPATGLAVLLAAALLVATPVQPWYAVTAGAVGVLVAAPWLILVAAAGEIYYAAVILGSHHQIGMGRLCYGAALVLVLLFETARRRRNHSEPHPQLIRAQ
jgi:Glycosyltransferase family 87